MKTPAPGHRNTLGETRPAVEYNPFPYMVVTYLVQTSGKETPMYVCAYPSAMQAGKVARAEVKASKRRTEVIDTLTGKVVQCLYVE